jgi:hypothetical protein
MVYYKKYLKYKSKYLNLQHKGGGLSQEIIDLPQEIIDYSIEFNCILEKYSKDVKYSNYVNKTSECHKSIYGLIEIFNVMKKGFITVFNINNVDDMYDDADDVDGVDDMYDDADDVDDVDGVDDVDDVDEGPIIDQSIIKTIKTLNEEHHYIIQIESVGHVFFIEYYNKYLRILSLYDGLHGFNDYLTNSVEIEHNYGKWFEFEGESKISSSFSNDINILNTPIDFTKNIRQQYEKLDETLTNMWGIGLNNDLKNKFLKSFTNEQLPTIGFNKGSKIVLIYTIVNL